AAPVRSPAPAVVRVVALDHLVRADAVADQAVRGRTGLEHVAAEVRGDRLAQELLVDRIRDRAAQRAVAVEAARPGVAVAGHVLDERGVDVGLHRDSAGTGAERRAGGYGEGEKQRLFAHVQ